jgi:inositol phosphorylceramide mannosyltransferase catalytic subunit
LVPRIIHQIFLHGPLPPELQQNVDRLKTVNPGWEHRLYDLKDAERIVAEYGGEIAEAYHRIDPRYGAAKADFLRHLIIVRDGGVYCDIKSGFSRPLDEVIRPDDSYILSQWANGPGEPYENRGLHRDLTHVPGGEFVTYFIISAPNHPFTEATIQRIVKNISDYKPWNAVGRNGVLRTTGPIAYTLAIHPLLNQHPHRFASEGELGAYPSIPYDHFAVFTNHYSLLRVPVVRLGLAGTALSRVFDGLRALKRKLSPSSQRSMT